MIIEKPSPKKFTTQIGGEWLNWDKLCSTDRIVSILFEDGSVFDRNTGWRWSLRCPCCGAIKQ